MPIVDQSPFLILTWIPLNHRHNHHDGQVVGLALSYGLHLFHGTRNQVSYACDRLPRLDITDNDNDCNVDLGNIFRTFLNDNFEAKIKLALMPSTWHQVDYADADHDTGLIVDLRTIFKTVFEDYFEYCLENYFFQIFWILFGKKFKDYFEEDDDCGPGTQQEQGLIAMDPSLR